MFKRWALLSVCLSFGLTQLAEAQAPLSIAAQVGVGDRVRPGAITPIEVILQNGDAPLDGRVRAAFFSMNSELNVSIYPVPLAPGASKRVRLYLPTVPEAVRYEIRYEVPGRIGGWRSIESLRQNLVQVDGGEPIFLVAGENNILGSLARGALNEPIQNGDFATMFMRVDQIPTAHEGMEMFDALFVQCTETDRLRPAQVDALGAWVLRGGILVVDASRRSQSLTTLADLLPFRVEGSEQKLLDVFGTETLVGRGVVQDGTVLLASNDTPLIVERPHGLGTVVAFAVGLDDPALAEWDGRGTLWSRVLGLHLKKESRKSSITETHTGLEENERVSDYQSVAMALRDSVSGTTNDRMRIGILILLASLYALIAGPGDFLFVRWMKRPRLTWITYPIIVTVFTLTAYFAAERWVGGEDAVRHAQRIVVFPDQDKATAFHLTDVFAGQSRDYHFSHPRDVRFHYLGDFFGLTDPMIVDAVSGDFIQRIPIWTHRVYTYSEDLETYPEVRVEWNLKDDRQGIIVITNNSDVPIRPSFAARAQQSWSLPTPPIQPGETKEIRLWAENLFRPLKVNYSLDIQSGLWTNQYWQSAFARELDSQAALARGAHIVSFNIEGGGPSFRLNGTTPDVDESQTTFQVVTYPNGIVHYSSLSHESPSD